METAPAGDSDRLILPREAAAEFGVKSKTLRRWYAQGLIRGRRTLGGQMRYWESSVRTRATELDEAVA